MGGGSGEARSGGGRPWADLRAGKTRILLHSLICLAALIFCLWPGLAAGWRHVPNLPGVSLPPDDPPAAGGKVQLLNNRAGGITGATPLTVAALVTPAGLSGRGQVVALADSGLDTGLLTDLHPDLRSSPGKMPKVLMLKSWAGRSVPDDPDGHGTHMAATIAGSGGASGGNYRGIAPGASIYFQALLDPQGVLSPPDDLAGLFAPAYAAGARIHVDGWGGGRNEYREEAAQIDAFSREHPDFLAVFGAGNAGPVHGSLTSEANAKNALVVGAGGNPRPALDPQAVDTLSPVSFSSRGPTADGRLKPDLLAPGQALVSARSRLVESNFPADQDYNLMGGTSMAAAVTGGSLALLREYLQIQAGVTGPSGALLKALLIEGARAPAGGPGTEGFGVLDLAATILGLEEGTLRYLDRQTGLTESESFSERLEVRDSSGPLKVTLAWTDPPGRPGTMPSLVNDLDLVVTAPDGQAYYGNHFLRRGAPDRVNNVEQVYLADPLPGTYVVTVKAVRVQAGATTPEYARAGRQDFALVWGQVPVTGVVASWEEGKEIILADGSKTAWPEYGRLVVDGRSRPLASDYLLPGADLYLAGDTAYIFAGTWQTPAGQAVSGKGGMVLMEADARDREGGYWRHPAAVEPPLVNGRPLPDLTDLAPGGEVFASVTPSAQRLWQIKISRTEKRGYVDRVDGEGRRLWLLGDDKAYPLAGGVDVSIVDHLVDAANADAPFGASREAGIGELAPGLAVRLVLGEKTDEVLSIVVERSLAVGRLSSVDPATGNLVLETGGKYQVFPNSPVRRDGREVALSDLRPGDHLTAVLLPDSSQAIRLVANSQVAFGRVLYAGAGPRTLYLVDEYNHFRLLPLARAGIYRWGQPADVSVLTPGSWVRLFADPVTGDVLRVDVAEAAAEVTGVLAAYDAPAGALRLAGGEVLPLSNAALITQGGYYLAPQDFVPGAGVSCTVLTAPAPWEKVVVGVRVEPGAGAVAPQLLVQSRIRGGGVELNGATTADRLFVYRARGARQEVSPAADGHFAFFLRPGPGEESLHVVGLDLSNGGLASKRITVATGFAGFVDVNGHWAQSDIMALGEGGVVGGYPDGTFGPDRPVTRVELVTAMARWLGLEAQSGAEPGFRDGGNIAPWARPAVAAAQEQGLVAGYPDGAFGPDRPVTRVELAVFVSRLLRGKQKQTQAPLPAYTDLGEVPGWARKTVLFTSAAGIMRGREGNRFEPSAPATRAEMAAALNSCWRYLVPEQP